MICTFYGVCAVLNWAGTHLETITADEKNKNIQPSTNVISAAGFLGPTTQPTSTAITRCYGPWLRHIFSGLLVWRGAFIIVCGVSGRLHVSFFQFFSTQDQERPTNTALPSSLGGHSRAHEDNAQYNN